MDPKLSDVAQGRGNNVGLIRLLAALAVTLAHSSALIEGSYSSSIGGFRTGFTAFYGLVAFFALSGFLVTESYRRSKSSISFVLSRFLRIFPGLLFANVITVLLVGWVVLGQGLELFGDRQHLRYLYEATVHQVGMYSGIFTGLPFRPANGSLWTLPVELRCYVLVFLLGILGFLRRPMWTLILFAAAVVALSLVGLSVRSQVLTTLFKFPQLDGQKLDVVLAFVFGIFASFGKHRLRLNPALALVGLLLHILSEFWILNLLAFIYALLVIAFHPAAYLRKLDFRFDLSYGIYLLSWPIQQTLIFHGMKAPLGLLLCTLAAVIPLALISWYCVEKPSLRLRDKWVRR